MKDQKRGKCFDIKPGLAGRASLSLYACWTINGNCLSRVLSSCRLLFSSAQTKQGKANFLFFQFLYFLFPNSFTIGNFCQEVAWTN